MRLQLLLMITEFGLSCYLTAKILNLPYTNAKVIYRVFREENRIISYTWKAWNSNDVPRGEIELRKSYPYLRQEALIKLANVLETGLLTEPQRAKIYDQNFDEFIGKKCITLL